MRLRVREASAVFSPQRAYFKLKKTKSSRAFPRLFFFFFSFPSFEGRSVDEEEPAIITEKEKPENSKEKQVKKKRKKKEKQVREVP